MIDFDAWASEAEHSHNGHDLTLLHLDNERRDKALKCVRQALPSHYASNDRLASYLRRLGKDKAADYVLDKLPTKKRGRSGDLCEILGVAFLEEQTIFDETLRKLRWSDHREQPMRGDDMIAVTRDIKRSDRLLFLKAEAKSRAKLNNSTMQDARKALMSDEGRPTPHALAFFSDRLFEEGRTELSDMVDRAQRVTGIRAKQITHMIFVVTGNSPKSFLETDLNGYSGDIEQWSVGLRIEDHQKFIADVYDGVDLDGHA